MGVCSDIKSKKRTQKYNTGNGNENRNISDIKAEECEVESKHINDKNEENPSNFKLNEVKFSIKENIKTDENKLFKGNMMNGGNSIQNNYNNKMNIMEKPTEKYNPYSKGINLNENKFNGNIQDSPFKNNIYEEQKGNNTFNDKKDSIVNNNINKENNKNQVFYINEENNKNNVEQISYINNENNKNNEDQISYPSLPEIDIKDKNDNFELKNWDYNVPDNNDISIEIEIPNPKPKEVESFLEVEKFMKENKIQDEFPGNEKEENENRTYIELKKYEKEKLKKIFLEKKENFEKNNFNRNNLILNLDINLISNIINNENTINVFQNKIFKEIELIKADEDKYKIDHLTILLVGKRKIGKKSLIKYILQLDDSQLKSEKGKKKKNFQAFQNPKIPYLRLVKYRGIGIGKENKAETITKETIDYISRQNKKGSYNDFVHCIWYCVIRNRMESLEDEYLLKLRNSYSNVNMPIILIYLNEYSKTKITEMEDKIKEKLDVDFINVISKQIKIPRNAGIINPRGRKELMNLTLDKCRAALKGDMPKIMMKNISNDILCKMKNQVGFNKGKVMDIIKKKFINEFTKALNDNEFIEYIINLLGRNLSIFYDKQISNNSLNLIINSQNIQNAKTFMDKCKAFTKNLISLDIITNANEFIDKQATLEKINKENINIEDKRSIKGFIKTNEIFLKKNFYYISQKFIISNFIMYYCNDYYNEFQNKFNDIIDNLINQDENSNINLSISNCFGAKLKKFGEKLNVNFEIEKYEYNFRNNFDEGQNNNIENVKLLLGNDNNNNSFDINYEEEIEELPPIKEDNEKIMMNYLSKIFKPKNDWKYLNQDLIPVLINFLINFKFKDTLDSFFKKNNYFNNSIITSLKEYEKNNLELFLNNSVQQFLGIIEENFKKINNKYELINNQKNTIKRILESEGIEQINLYKIKKEFDELGEDIQYNKLDYLTIIITGRTGVGKSALINALLKEFLTEEGMKDIVTTKPHKYENKKVEFLKLIDTRGIEIQEEFGVVKISEEIIKIINNPKELEKYKEENLALDFSHNKENEKDNLKCNDYVQCVWYCVTGSSMEKEEIEFVKKIKEQKNNIPVIIVYTQSQDEDDMNKMKNQVYSSFNNIPYVEVLAKDEEDAKSFGLDELINITIQQCKYAFESKTFEEMRKEINQTLIKNLKNKNLTINYLVNNESISYFINNFDKLILDNGQFKKFLYDLFAILFNGYFKKENKLEISENLYQKIYREFNNNNNISDYINEIINCYNKISSKFIDNIKEEKSIIFLDKQAIFEKINNNLEIKDKCNKYDFIKIIESFLKNNYNYLAQKYFIYQGFIPIIERFSEKIQNEVHENLINILLSNSQILQLFKNVYSQKIEDLNKIVQEYLSKEGYHSPNNDDKECNVIKKEKKDDMINVDEIETLNIK